MVTVMSDALPEEPRRMGRHPQSITWREWRWLGEQPLTDELMEAIYDRFHEKFYTDESRDHREFRRLLSEYQTGSTAHRTGIDTAMVTMTGYRLLSLMKLARGVPEESL